MVSVEKLVGLERYNYTQLNQIASVETPKLIQKF